MLPMNSANDPHSLCTNYGSMQANNHFGPGVNPKGEEAGSCNEYIEYGPSGKIKSRRRKSGGEEISTVYDEEGRTKSEHVKSCGGKQSYESRSEYEYWRNGKISQLSFENSFGELRHIEYNLEGKEVLETVTLKRESGVDYSSTTRFEYSENGNLRLKSFEDSLGEKRRIEYDDQGRKRLEDIRLVRPGQQGYVSRTEYAYTTDEVRFNAEK